jgi:hypothetical protein
MMMMGAQGGASAGLVVALVALVARVAGLVALVAGLVALLVALLVPALGLDLVVTVVQAPAMRVRRLPTDYTNQAKFLLPLMLCRLCLRC